MTLRFRGPHLLALQIWLGRGRSAGFKYRGQSSLPHSGTKSDTSMENPKLIVPVISVDPDLTAKLSNACSSASFVTINKEDVSLDALQDTEIIVGDPPLFGHLAFQLPKLKWVQSTFAGIDEFFQHPLCDRTQPSFVVTRLAGVFGSVMAEYVVGHIIAWEKKFTLTWQAQKDKKWLPWHTLKYRSLSEVTIGIIGVGDIGQTVAKYCKAMGMTVNCVRRKDSASKLPFVDNVFTLTDLPECLRQCDYFCNILPSTPATRGLLSGGVLENCKERKTVLINIGRGDVIDEESILKALDDQWIGGAILDVFEVEPLPSNSALWSHPRVTITPHTSGLRWGNEVVDAFLENFSAYQSGKPLKYVVDWAKGY